MISLTRCSMVFWSDMVMMTRVQKGSHRHTAVNGKNLAGDVAGFLGGEVGAHVGDVGGFAEAGHGDEGGGGLLDVLAELAGHVGFDEAGGDDVGGDVAFGEFLGD